jgi:hypothetical protein
MQKWELRLVVSLAAVGPIVGRYLFTTSPLATDIEFIKTISSFASLVSGILILVATHTSTVDVSSNPIMKHRVARIKICTFILLLLSLASFALSSGAIVYDNWRPLGISTTLTLLIATPLLLYRATFYED